MGLKRSAVFDRVVDGAWPNWMGAQRSFFSLALRSLDKSLSSDLEVLDGVPRKTHEEIGVEFRICFRYEISRKFLY